MGSFNKKRKSEVTEVDVYTENGLNARSAVIVLLLKMLNCLAVIRLRDLLMIDDLR